MRKIERIFVHCTASKQSWGVKELWAEFRHKGWKQPGYHYVITADGAIHQMLAVEEVSNGVIMQPPSMWLMWEELNGPTRGLYL